MKSKREDVIGHSRLIQLQQQSASIGLNGFADPALEGDYAKWIRLESAAMRRVLMVVPFLAMILAPLYGRLLLNSDDSAVFWLRVIEFGIAAPMCAISIGTLMRRPGAPASTGWLLATSIVVFWAVAMIRWVGAEAGGMLSPEIVMVVPLALAAVGRLRLHLLLPMVVLCPLLFLVGEWFVKGPTGFSATLLGTMLFCWLSLITGVATDRLSRRAWLSSGIAELAAMSDALTALPNRQWLNRDLATLFTLARRNREAVAIYLIDLDYFKRLNDTQGHAAGDAALTEIGLLLARYGRRALDLAGRYGGEEFLLALHNPTFSGMQAIAADLVEDIAELGIENLGAPLKKMTASIGVYMAIPGAQDRLEDFIQKADEALYAAKNAGRNRYWLGRLGGAEQDRPSERETGRVAA